MEALRIIKKPVNRQVVIDIPESFGDGEVEIIVLPAPPENGTTQSSKFDPRKFRGIWKGKNIDAKKVSKEMRAEWERDI